MHSVCGLKCHEPCAPCAQQCAWQCKHHKCKKLCSEPCDRPRCFERCDKKLKCGHQCVGICGEACPDVCRERQCGGRKVDVTDDLFMRAKLSETDPTEPLIMLDCKHIFAARSLDQHIANQVRAASAMCR